MGRRAASSCGWLWTAAHQQRWSASLRLSLLDTIRCWWESMFRLRLLQGSNSWQYWGTPCRQELASTVCWAWIFFAASDSASISGKAPSHWGSALWLPDVADAHGGVELLRTPHPAAIPQDPRDPPSACTSSHPLAHPADSTLTLAASQSRSSALRSCTCELFVAQPVIIGNAIAINAINLQGRFDIDSPCFRKTGGVQEKRTIMPLWSMVPGCGGFARGWRRVV